MLTPQHRHAILRQLENGKLESCAHWMAENKWQPRERHRSAQMTLLKKVWSRECRQHPVYVCPTCGRERICGSDVKRGLKKGVLRLFCRRVEFDFVFRGRTAPGLIVYDHETW